MPKAQWSVYPPWRGFYEALRTGNIPHVRHCLDQGMDMRLPVHRFYNALEFVTSHDHVELLKSMIRHRQFIKLPASERTSLLLEILRIACKNPSYEMLDYLLSIENPVTYEMECRDQCRRYIFDSTLGEDKDHLLPLLDYGEPSCSDMTASIKKQMREAFYTGAKNIRRQEVMWLMKNYDLTVHKVCDMLKLEFPISLLVCVANVEIVGRFVDQHEGLPCPIGSVHNAMKMSTIYDKKRRNVYEIAVKSGRADIVELLMKKTEQKLRNMGYSAAFRNTVKPIMLPGLLEKRAGIMDIEILKILPDEAFYFDGETVPKSESYHGLPWFFMGNDSKSVSDSVCVRFALAQAIAENKPDVFYFYMKRYNIPESHVTIESHGRWYKIGEYDSFLTLKKEPRIPLGFPLTFYSTFLRRDSETIKSLVMTGDVTVLQYMNQKFGILKSSTDWELQKYFSGLMIVQLDRWDSVVNRRYDMENNYRPLMPLVVIEHMAECLKNQFPRWLMIVNKQYAAIKSTLFEDGRVESYELAKTHAKHMIKIVLPRCKVIEDQQSHFNIDDCHDTFKAKRYAKGRIFANKYCKPKSGLFINSHLRERMLGRCIIHKNTDLGEDNNYRQAKLIAAMELHDFSQDFGPPVYAPKTYLHGMDREERRLFLRDFIMGLCGSHRCYIYWKGILKFLTADVILAVHKVARCQLTYKLLAETGVVIIDSSLRIPQDKTKSQQAADPFLKAKAKEHPDISAMRKNLSLASLCRISIHQYLRRSLGFQSDKIMSLDLPQILHDFLLFNDEKKEWENHIRLCKRSGDVDLVDGHEWDSESDSD